MANDGIKVHIYGDYDDKQVNKAIRDLQGLKTNAAGATPAMGGLNKAMIGLGGAVAGLVAFGAVTDFMGDAAQAAMDEEKSVRALSQAFDNLGLSAQLPMAERGIAQLSKMAAVADDDLRPALQTLVTATGSVEKSQALLETALNASAATGRSLESIVLGIAKASTGQVAALRKLGVPLDDNIVKTKDFGAAIDVMNAKFGGQAAAAAQTYAGQMKGIGIAADEAKEVIGGELLEAISEVSTAFGGTGGATNVIEGFGETVGNVIEVFGTLAAGIAALVAQQEQGTDSGRNFGDVLTGYATWVGAAVPPLGALANAFSMANDAGEVLQDSEAALKAQMDGLREAGGAGDAQMRRYALGIGAAAKEAYNADAAMEALKDAVKEFQDAISLSQSMDDFREDLRNIGADLKGAATTIFGPAGKDVRDKAREIFGQIPTIVQQMVDQGKIAAGDFDSTVDTMSRKAVRTFAKNGIDAKDLEDWLGGEGIWTDPVKDRMRQVATDAAAAATKAGKDLGVALAQGIPVGLLSQSRSVQAAGMRLIAQAEQAMKDAAIIKSPSKLFAEIGKDIALGVAVGIADTATAAGEASRDLIDSAFGEAQGALDDALEAVADFKREYVDMILGGVDLGAAFEAMFDKDGKATGKSYTDGILLEIEQGKWANNVFEALKAAGASPELLAMLYAKGADVGATYGQAILDEGSATLISDELGQLTTASDIAGAAMVPSFMTAGVAAAQALVDEFVKAFGPQGAGRTALFTLMDDLTTSMNRTAYIDVITRASTAVADIAIGAVAGARANGGPVSGGSTYLVGERGPELVTMGGDGFVTPNHALGSRGGNTYAVSVYVAPGGDLAGAGRQMVEAIRAYERSSGKVYAAA